MQHCENSWHPASQWIRSTFEQRTHRLSAMKIFTLLSLGAAVLGQIETQAKNERDEFMGSYSSLAEDCGDTKGCSNVDKEFITGETDFNITGTIKMTRRPKIELLTLIWKGRRTLKKFLFLYIKLYFKKSAKWARSLGTSRLNFKRNVISPEYELSFLFLLRIQNTPLLEILIETWSEENALGFTLLSQ